MFAVGRFQSVRAPHQSGSSVRLMFTEFRRRTRIITVAIALAGGLSACGQARVATRALIDTSASLTNDHVIVGDSSFLYAGDRTTGGLSIWTLRVVNSKVALTDEAVVGTGHHLEAPRAINMPDGSWAVTAPGCASEPRPDEPCGQMATFLFRIDPDGRGKEIGTIGGFGAPVFSIAGYTDSAHIVLRVQSVDSPAGMHSEAEKVQGTRHERFTVIDLKDGHAADVSWKPSDLSFSILTSEPPTAANSSLRLTCVADRTLYVLDSIATGDHVDRTLTVVDLERSSDANSPVQFVPGYLPSALFCDSSGLRVFGQDPTARTFSVFPLDTLGRVGEGESTTYGDRVRNLLLNRTSAFLESGPRPELKSDAAINEPSSIQRFADGKWTRLNVEAAAEDQRWMSGDGSSLLTRRASDLSFEGSGL